MDELGGVALVLEGVVELRVHHASHGGSVRLGQALVTSGEEERMKLDRNLAKVESQLLLPSPVLQTAHIGSNKLLHDLNDRLSPLEQA